MGLEAINGYGTQAAQTTQQSQNTQAAQLEQNTQGQTEQQGAVSTVSASGVQTEQPSVSATFAKEAQNLAKSMDAIEQENEKIRKAVAEMSKKMTSNTEAIFGIHDETNRVTIKLVDKDTKKVIREIPPEKTLDMIAKVWELAGILVDEKR